MGHEAGTSPHSPQDTGAASVGCSAFPSGEVPSQPPLTTRHTDMGGSWMWGAHRDPTIVSLQPLLSPGTALMGCTCSRVHRSYKRSPHGPARSSLARLCASGPLASRSSRPARPSPGQWSPSAALRASHAFWVLLCSGDVYISNSRNHFSQCQALLNKISCVNPQMEIDGLQNIWIVKPAAKSRGRGES